MIQARDTRTATNWLTPGTADAAGKIEFDDAFAGHHAQYFYRRIAWSFPPCTN